MNFALNVAGFGGSYRASKPKLLSTLPPPFLPLISLTLGPVGATPSLLALNRPRLQQQSRTILSPDSPTLRTRVSRLITIVGGTRKMNVTTPRVNFSRQMIIMTSQPGPHCPRTPLVRPAILVGPHVLTHDTRARLN